MSPACAVPCVLDVALVPSLRCCFHSVMNMILCCADSRHKKQDVEEWLKRQTEDVQDALAPYPAWGAEPWRDSRTGVPRRQLHNYSPPINQIVQQLVKVCFPGVEEATGQTEVSNVLKENSIFPIGKPGGNQSISALISKLKLDPPGQGEVRAISEEEG